MWHASPAINARSFIEYFVATRWPTAEHKLVSKSAQLRMCYFKDNSLT